MAQELTQAIGEPDQVNLVLQSGLRQIRLPGRNEALSGMNWLGRASDNPEAVDLVSVNASGKFAAITGMESPFTKKRSLVAIMAAVRRHSAWWIMPSLIRGKWSTCQALW
ncbi:cellulose biosynthesis cyclic di-GMP-binding regulatory protein BcsB [Photobacterium arenosum]|uniref:cellulose biosynthesis cyclic di-GMP-binding regulatory protein BcsB n=1 Tax=Photobacterium arenosum TaxID=2774143 RepID=UPI0035D013E2